MVALFDGAGQVATPTRTNGPPCIDADAIGNEVYRAVRHRDLNTAGMIARWRDRAIRFAATEPIGIVAGDGDCIGWEDVLVQLLFPRVGEQPSQTFVLAPVGPIERIGQTIGNHGANRSSGRLNHGGVGVIQVASWIFAIASTFVDQAFADGSGVG